MDSSEKSMCCQLYENCSSLRSTQILQQSHSRSLPGMEGCSKNPRDMCFSQDNGNHFVIQLGILPAEQPPFQFQMHNSCMFHSEQSEGNFYYHLNDSNSTDMINIHIIQICFEFPGVQNKGGRKLFSSTCTRTSRLKCKCTMH